MLHHACPRHVVLLTHSKGSILGECTKPHWRGCYVIAREPGFIYDCGWTCRLLLELPTVSYCIYCVPLFLLTPVMHLFVRLLLIWCLQVLTFAAFLLSGIFLDTYDMGVDTIYLCARKKLNYFFGAWYSVLSCHLASSSLFLESFMASNRMTNCRGPEIPRVRTMTCATCYLPDMQFASCPLVRKQALLTESSGNLEARSWVEG